MDGFIGQVMMFGGAFAPRDWAFCDGQLLSVSQFTALFSLIGTNYGGDGRTTFALPDLRGRVPVHPGQGPGLTDRQLGAKGGRESVTVTKAELPAHSHLVGCVDSIANVDTSVGNVMGREEHGAFDLYQSAAPDSTLNPAVVQPAGGDQAHDNMQPYLPLRYIICLNGIYPSRN